MGSSLETAEKSPEGRPPPRSQCMQTGFCTLRRRRGDNQAGLTLIELLFAMGIMGIVATGIFKLVMAHHATYLFQQSLVEGQQNGRIGLDRVARELRWAGYGLLETHPAGLVGGQSCHPWTSSKSYELVNEHSLHLLSNLHGVETHLNREALPGDMELHIPDDRYIQDNNLLVSRGQAFEQNDTIYIYRFSATSGEQGESPARVEVECHKLISNGTSGRIRLAPGDSIRNSFPPGSPVHVVNALHYFTDPKNKRLMRKLDGGMDVLADGVEAIVFKDFGNKIKIQLSLKGTGLEFPNHLWTIETSVVLRNR